MAEARAKQKRALSHRVRYDGGQKALESVGSAQELGVRIEDP